jgi:hypothetical protein
MGRASFRNMQKDQRLMASRHHGGLQGASRHVDMHFIDKANVKKSVRLAEKEDRLAAKERS